MGAQIGSEVSCCVASDIRKKEQKLPDFIDKGGDAPQDDEDDVDRASNSRWSATPQVSPKRPANVPALSLPTSTTTARQPTAADVDERSDDLSAAPRVVEGGRIGADCSMCGVPGKEARDLLHGESLPFALDRAGSPRPIESSNVTLQEKLLARQKLRSARDSGDLDCIHAALIEAKRVQLPDFLLLEAEQAKLRAYNREKARLLLVEAMKADDRPRCVGRQQREEAERSLDALRISNLRVAVDFACQAGLAPEEYDEAAYKLQELEDKQSHEVAELKLAAELFQSASGEPIPITYRRLLEKSEETTRPPKGLGSFVIVNDLCSASRSESLRLVSGQEKGGG
eukprot:gnl/TRDRNA2_/TRDRNA2_157552_c0_seq2.p1 gnl/TRDRNA2_/TRDRNA2_157552_c0~~gnl/TRDRNA2_/TRDRNA2_157552_c0_seq2.p1  ORF type:complete len:342 (-),score=84.79 gnl/TRDRNA2_/TRDRNA2_157552_c0_seq2:170-1195(-)